MVTYNEIKNNEEIKTYIRMADETMNSLKFTEHSFAHVVRTSDMVGQILSKLGYSRRTVELGQIAGYMHDIGNVINRIDHAQSGAVMAFRLLDKMGMAAEETAKIICAIGNHDEHTAYPVNELAAALIIADKSDVRRSRVRAKADIDIDIHDRVNFSVKQSEVHVVNGSHIELNLVIDTTVCAVMDYFEIFMGRMILCRKAAEKLALSFRLVINGQRIL